MRDVVQFKQADAVLQIGRFGHPARLEDVAELTLERDDLDNLRECRPGSCDVQLSADAIARFTREVPWRSSSEAETAANRLFRALVVDLVTRYRSSGDAGLMTYHNRRQPLSLADEFRAIDCVAAGDARAL